MKCKYCESEMKEFTKSSLCCFNDNCPHRQFPPNKREGFGSSAYSYVKDSSLPSKENVK